MPIAPATGIGGFGQSERERILDTATDLFAQRGYETITVAEVVDRSGVPAEAFESLFGGVEECLLAAMNAFVGEIVTAVSSSYSADCSEWDSGLLGMKAILELMAAHPSYAHLAYIGARQMAPARILNAHLAAGALITALIERLWAYSDGDVQPAKAARAVLGACEAVVRREIVGGDIEQLPRLLPDFAYAAVVPFLGQEEALRLSRRARELLRGTEWE